MLQSALSIADDKNYLRRPHIHNLFKQSLEKKVTTVVAGAGYGKTQAVYKFLQEYNAVTIWLQLSQFDNLPSRLWESFIYAVSLQNKILASELKIMGFPQTMQEYYRFLNIFSNATKLTKKYVLVYDDFHLIHDEHVLDFFERFINANVPNLSIVIISRNEPDINVLGLLSKDMISITDEDDLRFSKEEMYQYFEMQDVHLSAKAISDVYTYTEGWIFAIYLVGFTLKKGLNNEDYAISVAKQNVVRLIETELFSSTSKELQEFLVKISLIDNLPSELLATLCSGKDELITEMMKISSFIRYDDFLKTYRIHHLFLEFLCERQFILKTEDKIEVYNKAADWYDNNGYYLDALAYYEKAGQYDELLRTAARFYADCPKETAQYILDILDRILQEIYEIKPLFKVFHAKFTLNCFRFEDSFIEATKIIEKYESMSPTEENRIIMGETYIILGLGDMGRWAYTGNLDFSRYFKLADKYLPKGSMLIDGKFQLNTGTYSSTVRRSIRGEFDRYANTICNIIPYLSKVTHGCGLGSEHRVLAEKFYFQNDMKNANIQALQAISESENTDQYATECLAIFFLVKIYTSYGNYSKIMPLFDRLKSVCKKCNTSIAYNILDIAEGWFYSQIKQPDKVTEWIRNDSESSRKSTTPIDYVLGRIIRARCFFAEGKYYELLAYLEKEEKIYGLEYFLLGRIEKSVLKAVALYHIKEIEAAVEILEEAYQMAAPDTLFMPFIELGSKMRTLTKAAMHNKNCNIPKQWLEMISTKSSSYAKRVSVIYDEYRILNHLEDDIRSDFTQKELELLAGLCHGLSREEIAVDLGLSINTVKSSLQIIFNKLGAINTVDAVRIATSLKLLE